MVALFLSVIAISLSGVMAPGPITAATLAVAPRSRHAGALIAVYLFASAAGGTLPLPPILGTTEIALVSALVISGYTSASAITAVLIFRAISYWLPLPIGAWAARRLRRAKLL